MNEKNRFEQTTTINDLNSKMSMKDTAQKNIFSLFKLRYSFKPDLGFLFLMELYFTVLPLMKCFVYRFLLEFEDDSSMNRSCRTFFKSIDPLSAIIKLIFFRLHPKQTCFVMISFQAFDLYGTRYNDFQLF